MTEDHGGYWGYDYDDLGQVTRGEKFMGNGFPLPGQKHEYDFDMIGNRISTTTNGRLANYFSNSVNQYTSRQVPDAVDVFGVADTDVSVTVNDLSTTRVSGSFIVN